MKKNNNIYCTIKEIAQRIGTKFHPKKIILFGSYAHGNPHRDSDVDLLIIFPGKKKSPFGYSELSKEFEPRPFPVDLIIRTTDEIKQRLQIGDSFIRDIIHKGKVLYES